MKCKVNGRVYKRTRSSDGCLGCDFYFNNLECPRGKCRCIHGGTYHFKETLFSKIRNWLVNK